MSRSLRHSPIVPRLNVETEKDEKRAAHHRERKWLHDHLTPTAVAVEDFDIPTYRLHPHAGHDGFAKGGKEFLGSRVRFEDPRSLRK